MRIAGVLGLVPDRSSFEEFQFANPAEPITKKEPAAEEKNCLRENARRNDSINSALGDSESQAVTSTDRMKKYSFNKGRRRGDAVPWNESAFEERGAGTI
jgi:hypothetical protein